MAICYGCASPREAIAAGICLLTEDRKSEGLVLGLSVRENFALAEPAEDVCAWPSSITAENAPPSPATLRPLTSRCPARSSRSASSPAAISRRSCSPNGSKPMRPYCIFDEPTRGIDVGAKYDIYKLINDLAAQGKAILIISSELPEVLGMCDRIVVMHEGRISGEITDVKHATQEQILRLAVG